jgi:hypothetical protein
MVSEKIVHHVTVIVGILFVALFGTAFLFNPFIITGAFAQVNTTDNVTVNISVGELAEITVNPINFTLIDVPVGTDTSEVSFSIKNTGSTNITNIFAYSDTIFVESESVVDTGDPTKYAAAGFVFIRNESSDGISAHVGKLEWNTSTLESENLNLDPGTAKFGRGWYHNASNTWLWKVENGSNGTCNNTGTDFKIKEAPENGTSPLNRDFTDGIVTTGTFDEQTANWSLFNMGGTVLNYYCVAAYWNCTKIYIFKYDKRYDAETNFDGCDNAAYMREAILYPAQSIPFYLYGSVPKGTPYGLTTSNTLVLAAT